MALQRGAAGIWPCLPATVLSGALTRAVGETVAGSPYAITQETLTANSNYIITFAGNALAIAPATLTIAAQPKTKIYGATDPALTFTVGVLQFSDTPATVLTGALTRIAGETVVGSPYAIMRGTLTVNGNYTLGFTGNTLAVTKAALSVTDDAKTKTYGATDPAFTVIYTGFVNSETSAVLGGTLATQRSARYPPTSFARIVWGLHAIGIALALYVFMADALRVVHQGLDATTTVLPKAFNWSLFRVAFTLMAAPVVLESRALLAIVMPSIRRRLQRPGGV